MAIRVRPVQLQGLEDAMEAGVWFGARLRPSLVRQLASFVSWRHAVGNRVR